MGVKPRKRNFAAHPGIYAIRRIGTNDCYVGSSKNVYSRWRAHLADLRRGIHHCAHLQNAWKKYGESAFEFEVLESCLPDNIALRAREDIWFDRLRDGLYNSTQFAEPASGGKCSPEHKAKMSAFMMGNKNGEGTHYHGDLTADDVVKILYRYASGDSTTQIAVDFDVSVATIFRIANRKIWWRVEIPPEVEAARARRHASKHNHFRGAGSPVAKLTWEQVESIRERRANGEHEHALASEFNVCKGNIHAIVTNRTWTKRSEVFETLTPPVPEVVRRQPLPKKPRSKKQPLDPRRNRKVERVPTTCYACAKAMMIQPCRLRNAKTVFCSLACRNSKASERAKASMANPETRRKIAEKLRGQKQSGATITKRNESRARYHSAKRSHEITLPFGD